MVLLIRLDISTKLHTIIHGGVTEQDVEKKNLGWRIDYNFVSSSMLRNLSSADILSDVVHSDHCPVTLELID